MSTERVHRLLSAISEWTPELHISSLDHSLYALHEEELTDEDEQKLRTILKTNPHLRDPDLQAFVETPSLADDYWWLDPDKW